MGLDFIEDAEVREQIKKDTLEELEKREQKISDGTADAQTYIDIVSFYYSLYDDKELIKSKADTAIEFVGRDIRNGFEKPVDYVNLGKIYHLIDEHKTAIEHYNTALKLHPDFVPALLGRAAANSWLLTFKREPLAFEKAENDLKRVIELEPNNVEAYREMTYLYQGCLLYDKAIEVAEKLVELSPDDEWRLESAKSCSDIASQANKQSNIILIIIVLVVLAVGIVSALLT